MAEDSRGGQDSVMGCRATDDDDDDVYTQASRPAFYVSGSLDKV